MNVRGPSGLWRMTWSCAARRHEACHRPDCSCACHDLSGDREPRRVPDGHLVRGSHRRVS